MKENSITIIGMERGSKDIKTATLIMENFDLERLMEKDCTDGLITRSTMVNGKMD